MIYSSLNVPQHRCKLARGADSDFVMREIKAQSAGQGARAWSLVARVIRFLVLSFVVGSVSAIITYFYGVRAYGVMGPGGRVPIDHGFPVPWVRESFTIPTLPATGSVLSISLYELGIDVAFWAVVFYVGYRIFRAVRRPVRAKISNA